MPCTVFRHHSLRVLSPPEPYEDEAKRYERQAGEDAEAAAARAGAVHALLRVGTHPFTSIAVSPALAMQSRFRVR